MLVENKVVYATKAKLTEESIHQLKTVKKNYGMGRVDQIKAFLLDAPGDAFLQHALALEYIKLGEEEEARNLFENILSADPNYVGSYYHLGKLYERLQQPQAALETYATGIEYARKFGDRHAGNELQAAKEELEENLED